jgi:2-keto-4-pentenoate hydratase/2-oxohepta-3-ene-1,7-dioic acid hydratase in catechol pathway
MRIARIIAESGETTLAVKKSDGTFVKAEGDILAGTIAATQTAVTPATWLAPVEPRMLFCIGRNYAEHAKEGGADLPEWPIVFAKNPAAAHGHLQPVRIPKVCEDEVDYEGELAVVIGKTAKDVSEADALDYVAGYMCGNDVSARVWQAVKGGSQWVRGKGFDTFAPMGPFLVTPDEVPDIQALDIRTLVDGEVVQHSNTRHMIFPIATLISFLSQDTTLLPGTIILTGTPEGVGWFRQPRLTLKPGHVVRVEIEGIGALENSFLAQ